MSLCTNSFEWGSDEAWFSLVLFVGGISFYNSIHFPTPSACARSLSPHSPCVTTCPWLIVYTLHFGQKILRSPLSAKRPFLHASFSLSFIQRKGHPTVDPKSKWHQGVYDSGAFKLDHLETIKPTFSKEMSTLLTSDMQHVPFPMDGQISESIHGEPRGQKSVQTSVRCSEFKCGFL